MRLPDRSAASHRLRRLRRHRFRMERRRLDEPPRRARPAATPASGSTGITSTACASTPSPRCSIATTRAGKGEWVPNAGGGRENIEAIDFVRRVNGAIQERFPGALIIAEESTSWPGVSRPPAEGGLGFGYKWNMGWMNDVLRYMSRDPAERRCHQSDLTFGMLYACSENFVLTLSHDEVVHGKGSLPGRMARSDRERFANVRLLLAFMYGRGGRRRAPVRVQLLRGDTPGLRAGAAAAGPLRGAAQHRRRGLLGKRRRESRRGGSDPPIPGTAWTGRRR